jgi:uncharacterized protein
MRLLPGLALAAALTCAAAPSTAADFAAHTIVVSGSGDATAVPDQVQLSAGVTTVAATADAALAENARKMTQVFDALRRLGVAGRAIQTSNFSVQPQYGDGARDGTPPRITGYQVSNQVDVTLGDVKKLGPALDALVAAGANQINSVNYTIKDQSALMTQARTAAIADAKARAETYAKAAGVSVGGVIAIEEAGSDTPRPMFRAAAFLNNVPSTPVASGELSISASVTVVFELK